MPRTGPRATSTVHTRLDRTQVGGDEFPAPLISYFQLLDAGRPRDAAACYASETTCARPPAGESEGRPRDVFRSRGEVEATFVARGSRPVHHHVQNWAASGHDLVLEGTVHDAAERPVMGFLSTARVRGGVIERYVAFRSRPPRARHPSCGYAGDPAGVATEHLDALARGDLGAACALLDEQVTYLSTDLGAPAGQLADLVDVESAAAVRDRLAALHGARGLEVIVSAVDGSDAYLELLVHGDDPATSRTLVCRTTLSPAGLITDFRCHACSPAVPFR